MLSFMERNQEKESQIKYALAVIIVENLSLQIFSTQEVSTTYRLLFFEFYNNSVT